ncbi:hypothetical protein TpMuguga_03g00297 [Theileria parva strain Muguga]|uniref:SfiI-subtelomeric related protein family member n=1 Tax=Theileria parva TaxID=5875 RepID=Q4N057_THEPA|nr:uncharacterized protein TpMuguga_03g00297 [Theileria parva strain Muguga]EAN31032.1 hypothetical protein TpMuguga_03g00297 [Theileria parva strain Muguga]|eukprot:XP_763315.1 hypothetical protein [Theileria parva strain Muguga]
MKIVKLALIAVIISCPYKLVYASDTTGTSQSTTADSDQTSGTGQATTPSTQTTSSETTSGTTSPGTQTTTPSSAAATPAAKANLKPVTLDIKKSNSTDESEYLKDGNYRTYTPKPSNAFSKIVKGNNDVWTSTGNDNAVNVVLMGSGNNPKHLAILLNSGKLVFLYKEGKNKPWTDITSQKHDLKKLKFLGENNTELTSSSYKITIVNLSYTFTFNDGVNCLTIKLGDKDIWKSSDDSNFESIKTFYLDLSNNLFSVTNSKDQTKQVTKPEVTKVTIDINTTQGTAQFDHSKSGENHTYTAKSGHGFNKVTEGNSAIWESKEDVYGTLVRTKTVDKKDKTTDIEKYLAILLDNNSFKLFEKKTGGSWTDITDKKRDVTKLKFYGENDIELTTSDYTVTILNFPYRVTFNSGVKCKKITYGGDDVWNSTDDTEFKDISMFSLGLISNEFFVLKSESHHKKVEVKKSDGKTKTGTGGSQPATGGSQPTSGGQTGTGASQPPTGATPTPTTGTGQTSTTPASGAATTTTPTPGSGTSQPATGATTPNPETGAPTGQTGSRPTTTTPTSTTTTVSRGQSGSTPSTATPTGQTTATPATTPAGQTGTGTRSTPATTTAGSTTSGRRTRSSPST